MKSFYWARVFVLDPWPLALNVCCRRTLSRAMSTESRSEDNPYDFRHLLRKTSQRRKLIKHYWAAAAELSPFGLVASTDVNFSKVFSGEYSEHDWTCIGLQLCKMHGASEWGYLPNNSWRSWINFFLKWLRCLLSRWARITFKQFTLFFNYFLFKAR